MKSLGEPGRLSLLQLLQNSLLLRHTSPYIGLNGLVSLAAASKSFRSLLLETPQVFNRIDVSNNKFCALQIFQRGPDGYNDLTPSMLEPLGWNVRAAETMYEQHRAYPLESLLGHLIRLDLLRDVRTLILDGLSVPNTFLSALLCGETKYRIRLLSMRGVVILNANDFAQCLTYLVQRPQPPDGPTLKGLYFFTPLQKTSRRRETVRSVTAAPRSTGVTNSLGAQLGSEPATPEKLAQGDSNAAPASGDIWYSVLGEVQLTPLYQLWADVLEACNGLIAFDATVCRHDRGIYKHPWPQIANVRLSGCHSCGSSPEGPAYPGMSDESHLPLVSPPPMHSFSVKAAQRLDTCGRPQPAFIARCKLCLKDRWCEQCNAWWCEACYNIPSKREIPALASGGTSQGVFVLPPNQGFKVHNGLCVSKCLVDELLTRGGEGGMWG